MAAHLDLTSDELASINIVVCGAHGPHGDVYSLERVKNGRHGNIMKYNLNQLNQGTHLEELCQRYSVCVV